jgi:hypothetical protein
MRKRELPEESCDLVVVQSAETLYPAFDKASGFLLTQHEEAVRRVCRGRLTQRFGARSCMSCLIWGTKASIEEEDGIARVTSNRSGGSYSVAEAARTPLAALSEADKAKLTTWLVDGRRQGEPSPLITPEVIEWIKKRRRLTVTARSDRLLLLRAELGDNLGTRFRTGGTFDTEVEKTLELLVAWTESLSNNEVMRLLQALANEGLLNEHHPAWEVSVPGWERIDELRSAHGPFMQVFVAMWFSDETAAAWKDGIEPAVRESGYRPLRIDRKDHINKIDDEIIMELRRSRFIVADFTSEPEKPRGGVYFEAGFAMGLSIPVIWTCRRDLLSQVHFDTNHFNYIDWTDPADLKARLHKRIGAVIGFGPETTD